MERSLEQAGYHVCNIEYLSRAHSVAELARDHVAPRIAECAPANRGRSTSSRTAWAASSCGSWRRLLAVREIGRGDARPAESRQRGGRRQG
ncbi:MAG: hypothetical protein IPK33_13600 [Gemmatimonadetes bacterium]|nr:hypothetical protein [Gemmatimonadota bacterium]